MVRRYVSKGINFTIMYRHFNPLPGEFRELEDLIDSCNWDAFDDEDVLYFQSNSETTIYDFEVRKISNTHIDLIAISLL